MQISLLLMEEIAKLFAIMLMGYAVVKAGLMKSSESKSISVVMVYLVIPCVIIDAFQVDYTPDVKKRTAPGMCGSSSGTCFISERKYYFNHSRSDIVYLQNPDAFGSAGCHGYDE